MASRWVNKVILVANLGQLRTRNWQVAEGQEKFTTEAFVNVGGSQQMLGARDGNGRQPEPQNNQPQHSASVHEGAAEKGEEEETNVGLKVRPLQRRMTGAVLYVLKLEESWCTDFESRGEWGGVFPVHLRLTHHKCKHVTIDILSPSGKSPSLHGLMWLNPNHTDLFFWNSEHLAINVIRALLQRIDEMVRAGFTTGEIADVLRRWEIN